MERTIIVLLLIILFITFLIYYIYFKKHKAGKLEMIRKYKILVYNIVKTDEFNIYAGGKNLLYLKSIPSLINLELEMTQSSNILSIRIAARLGINSEETKIEFREDEDQKKMTYFVKFLLSSMLQKQVDKAGTLLPDKQAYIDRYKWNKTDDQ